MNINCQSFTPFDFAPPIKNEQEQNQGQQPRIQVQQNQQQEVTSFMPTEEAKQPIQLNLQSLLSQGSFQPEQKQVKPFLFGEQAPVEQSIFSSQSNQTLNPAPFQPFSQPKVQEFSLGNFMEKQEGNQFKIDFDPSRDIHQPDLKHVENLVEDYEEQSSTQQECEEYKYGFCMQGPSCSFQHIEKPPEDLKLIQKEKLPQWYIQKVSNYFNGDGVTNYNTLYEFLFTNLNPAPHPLAESINNSYHATSTGLTPQKFQSSPHPPMYNSPTPQLMPSISQQPQQQLFDQLMAPQPQLQKMAFSSLAVPHLSAQQLQDQFDSQSIGGLGTQTLASMFSDVNSEMSESMIAGGFSHRSNVGYYMEDWNKKIQECPVYCPNAKFYVMKSSDKDSIEISQQHGVWSTTYGPTRKLSEAFRQHKNIFLIFSVNESGGYQGFAKMKSAPDQSLKPNVFKKTQFTLNYHKNFEVEWLAKDILYHFRNLNNFPENPLNDYKTIMQSKNCQELPFEHGNYLIQQLLEMSQRSKGQYQQKKPFQPQFVSQDRPRDKQGQNRRDSQPQSNGFVFQARNKTTFGGNQDRRQSQRKRGNKQG